MKEDNSAERLYESLPCHNNKVFIALNYKIEKSAAKAACLPSFPTIPTPISAAWIIPTSFPPSPIPKTAYFSSLNSLIPAVRVLFCWGEHLQQMTAGIFIAVL